MYRIERGEGVVKVFDWNGKLVYTADDRSMLVYENSVGQVTVGKPLDLSDGDLLLSLAKTIKINS